jgi:uncharacterized protein (DUF58 family)
VDWLAYARTGEPVVKLFRAEEDTVFRLLIDASQSVEFGDPTKLEVMRRLSAAIGYMALSSSERVQVCTAQSAPDAGDNRGLSHVGTPRRGRSALAALLTELQGLTTSGSANLSKAIEDVVRRSPRPGLLVVLSDFLDPGPVTLALGRARSSGHQVALLHVLARDELEPHFEGDVSLVDSETGATLDVTMDPSAIEAYVLRLAGLVEELRAWARKHGASYVRVANDEALDGAIRRFVARAID